MYQVIIKNVFQRTCLASCHAHEPKFYKKFTHLIQVLYSRTNCPPNLLSFNSFAINEFSHFFTNVPLPLSVPRCQFDLTLKERYIVEPTINYRQFTQNQKLLLNFLLKSKEATQILKCAFLPN